MKILFTDKFLEDLASLSKGLQTKCRALVGEISHAEPKTFLSQSLPGWRLHKLRSSPFCSLSLDMNYRILAKIDGGNLFMHRVVKHDLADSPHVNQNEQASDYFALSESSIQLGQLHGALIALGVPPQKIVTLGKVRTEDDLIEALERIDPDYRNLVLSLYETTGLIIPRTQYRLFKPDDELEYHLLGTSAEWEYYLHPSQKYVSELPAQSRILISGSAGTGKSVCAWYRLKHLATSGLIVGFLCPSNVALAVSRAKIESLLGKAFINCHFFVPNSINDIRLVLHTVRHLVIDEGQDLPPTWLDDLSHLLERSSIGCTIFYDLNQTDRINVAPSKLDAAKVAIERALLRLPGAYRIEFAINYRNSREIAEFIVSSLSHALPWGVTMEMPAFSCGDVVIAKAKNEDRCFVVVADAITRLRQDYRTNEMALLVFGSAGLNRRLLYALRLCNINVSTHLDADGILVLTKPQSIKGHERKAVIVIMPSLEKLKLKAKHAITAYIAFSRARDRLIIVQIEEADDFGDS